MVVTTGPQVDPEVLRTAPNHEVHRFVPHEQLLPGVSLVVGHGGHGTTMKALAHDLPLVLLPLHPLVDQPMVAASVQRAGAGRVVSPRTGTEQLGTVIVELLADGPHRRSAARLGAAIRTMPGAVNGADVIETLLAGGRWPATARTGAATRR